MPEHIDPEFHEFLETISAFGFELLDVYKDEEIQDMTVVVTHHDDLPGILALFHQVLPDQFKNDFFHIDGGTWNVSSSVDVVEMDDGREGVVVFDHISMPGDHLHLIKQSLDAFQANRPPPDSSLN